MLVDMVAGLFTPVSSTGGRNSYAHSDFQGLCSCRGCVIFHNQPEGSQVLASSLSSDPLNVSGSFTEGWHQEAHRSGCCVWVYVDDHISDPFALLVCGHQSPRVKVYWTAVSPDFCIHWSYSPCQWMGSDALRWINFLFGTIYLPQRHLNSLLGLQAPSHTVKHSAPFAFIWGRNSASS